MGKTSIKNFKIAKRYANALYEAAKEGNIIQEIFDDLKVITSTFEINKELNDFMLNPLVSTEDKKATAQNIFHEKINKITQNFLLLLIDSARTDAILNIKDDFESRYNADLHIEKAVITSALDLDEETKSRIIKKLEEKLSAQILPIFQTEPAIIGGLIIEAKDKTVDLSLKTKFNNMKKQLVKG